MKLLFPLVLGLVLGHSGFSDENLFEATSFEYGRDLTKVEMESSFEGVGFLRIDPHIYENSAERLADLRLVKVQGDGKEVEWPYLVKAVQKPSKSKLFTEEIRIPSELLSFEEDKENRSIEMVYSVLNTGNEPGTIASLKVTTPLQDFEKQISVYSSVDQVNWKAIVVNRLIFDRSRFIDFRATEIQFADSRSPYFKVQIHEATDQQIDSIQKITKTQTADRRSKKFERQVTRRVFRIDNIDFYSPPKETPHRDGAIRSKDFQYNHEFAIRSVDNNTERKTTHLYFDGSNLPLDQLSAITADRNFRRHFSLQVPASDSSKDWIQIVRGTIHRYDIAGFQTKI